MNSNNQIKRGAFFSYIGIGVNTLAGLIYTPWMINQIGTSDYGLYALALSVVNFFLFDFGLGSVVSRYISLYRAKNQEEKISDLLGAVAKIYIFLDLIIASILFIILMNIESIFVEMSLVEIQKLKNVFLLIAVFSLFSFPLIPVGQIYVGFEKFSEIKIFNLIAKLTTVFTIVLALCFGGGLYVLVIVNTFGNLVFKIAEFLYIYVYMHRKKALHINFKYRNYDFTKKILRFSIWVTIIGVCARLVININPSILGALSGTEQVSLFSIGSSIEGYVWTFSNAMNGLFLPKVTRLSIADESEKGVNNLMIKVGRIQLIIVGGIIAGLFCFGKEFFVIWLGEEFIASYYVALLLIVPGIVTLTQDIAVNYLMAINEIKWRAVDFISTAAISVILSFVLSPRYGAIGAAFAVFLGLVLGHIILMNIIYKKKFNIDVCFFFKNCHLKYVPIMFVMVLLGIGFQSIFPSGNLGIFIAKAVAWGVCYLIITWFFFLSKGEKVMFKNLLRKNG